LQEAVGEPDLALTETPKVPVSATKRQLGIGEPSPEVRKCSTPAACSIELLIRFSEDRAARHPPAEDVPGRESFSRQPLPQFQPHFDNAV